MMSSSDEYILNSSFAPLETLPDNSIPELLLRIANEQVQSGNGQKLWIEDAITNNSYNYENFEKYTKAISSGLYQRGFRKGDTVIYSLYDIANIHVFFTGVWLANGIVRSSYPEDLEETLISRIKDSQAKWIFCDNLTVERCLGAIKKIEWNVKVVIIGTHPECISFSDLLQDNGSNCPDLKIGLEDPALILCTSGSTGSSKGAQHTHKSIVHLCNLRQRIWKCTAGKSHMFICKSSHISGATSVFGTFLMGSIMFVVSNPTKENILTAVRSKQPAFIHGGSSYLVSIANAPSAESFDFIQGFYTGGGAISSEIESRLMSLPNVKDVVAAYGLTESIFSIVSNDIDYSEFRKIPGVPPQGGKVGPTFQVKISDLTTGEILGPSHKGEICIKGLHMFSKYLNDPEKTEQAFDKEGWFKTGDLGFHENDFVFVIDRIKSVFKNQGNHVSPVEIESIIQKHPAISQVCVIGTENKNSPGDYIPTAFVSIRKDIKVTPDEITRFANEQLPDYKHLDGGLFILDQLPQGLSGKTDILALQKMFTNNLL